MKKYLIFFIFFLQYPTIYGQDSTLNKAGLYVIKNVKIFLASFKDHPEKRMVDIKTLAAEIQLDLRYASANNFMNKKLYPTLSTTYLRLPAALALKQIQNELKEKGLGLKIFDAYRPYYVTVKMWEPIKDERYVADPKKGSGHNRGTAADLTIINLLSNKELNMGTGYDNFSDTAHHSFNKLSPEILKNRLLLKSTMEKYGFKSLESEWWHYSLVNATSFELLNLSFKQLKKLN